MLGYSMGCGNVYLEYSDTCLPCRKNEYPKSPPRFYEVTSHSKERPDVWIDSPDKSIILSIMSDIRTIKSGVFVAPYSLRFPRIQCVRYDKPWHECLDLQFALNHKNARRYCTDALSCVKPLCNLLPPKPFCGDSCTVEVGYGSSVALNHKNARRYCTDALSCVKPLCNLLPPKPFCGDSCTVEVGYGSSGW
ncbi:uncharacterized protein A4U43_C03F12090 [Asparagus officinalis]|uniref:Uncharacterized protein n=1 Tax=Asparagus officinalis TaxID=4686 RepID=A0A5P1F9Y8_ASPOF|nr:uncharacterized protein A4U43_C03F12090 [Asparagus officinalis]